MKNIRYLNSHAPRIRIIAIPDAGSGIPQWFLEIFIGLILPVENYVKSFESYPGYHSTSTYEFWVKKEKVLAALSRKSKDAADFLSNHPGYLKETVMRFNEEACEFLGSWEELRRKSNTAQI